MSNDGSSGWWSTVILNEWCSVEKNRNGTQSILIKKSPPCSWCCYGAHCHTSSQWKNRERCHIQLWRKIRAFWSACVFVCVHMCVCVCVCVCMRVCVCVVSECDTHNLYLCNCPMTQRRPLRLMKPHNNMATQQYSKIHATSTTGYDVGQLLYLHHPTINTVL